MNKNKRQFIRLNASVRIVIIPYEVTDERLLIKDEKDVSTKNISAGGILFRSNQTLPVNSLVEVKIFLPSEPNPIDAIGEIRHMRRLKQSPEFDVGIRFLKIAHADQAKLLQLKKIS